MFEQAWSSPTQVPHLSAQTVQVWRLDLNCARLRPVLRYADSVMSTSERARDRRFLTLRGSESFRCGRGLLRLLLEQALGISAKDVEVFVSANGKPSLAQDSQIHFSLSHSSSTLLLALSSNGEVGIDVEDRATDALIGEDVICLAADQFHPNEVPLLTSARTEQERLSAFLRVWTAREAIGKAAGIGISNPSSIVSTSPAVAGSEAVAASWKVVAPDGGTTPYRLLPLQGIDGCIASLALEQEIRTVLTFRAEALFDDGERSSSHSQPICFCR